MRHGSAHFINPSNCSYADHKEHIHGDACASATKLKSSSTIQFNSLAGRCADNAGHDFVGNLLKLFWEAEGGGVGGGGAERVAVRGQCQNLK